MKHFKSIIRIWIALCSLAGFFGGWAMLAHSPKPAQVAAGRQAVAASGALSLPPLPPMPSFSQAQANFQPIPFQPQTSFALPRLRTGGS
jgi:hypothetical protein